MNLLNSVHLASTAANFTIILLAQVLLYPQFRNVPTSAFPKFHEDHMRLMARAVGPTLLIEGGAATILLATAENQTPLTVAAYLLLAATTISTFCIFVPLHSKLQKNHDEVSIERLIAANKGRVWLQSARLILVIITSSSPR